jgi:Rps23 Pro-64 3,4-dihydroxylase Tpa1-like proline 4-hydroxylase
MDLIDFERLQRVAEQQHDTYASAEPFPHIVIDDFLPPDVAEALLRDFESTHEGWKHYNHYNERKLALTDQSRMPTHTQRVIEALQSKDTTTFVGTLSGISDLIPDPDLEGAGMHLVKRDGFLNIHTDFLTHTKKPTWARRINLLIYLNKDWEPEWQGDLEFWDRDMSSCVQSISPRFNRCVIFSTIQNSFHGHPRRLACPPDRSRQCLLLYYYTDEHHNLAFSSTDYRAIPGAGLWERAMIVADRIVLRAYTFLKQHSQLGDELVSRILKRF